MLASFTSRPPSPTRNTNTPVAPLNNVIVAPPPSPHSKLSLNHLKISQGGLSLVMLCRPRRSARRESRFDPPLARSGAATPCSVRVGTRRQLLEQQKKKEKKECTVRFRRRGCHGASTQAVILHFTRHALTCRKHCVHRGGASTKASFSPRLGPWRVLCNCPYSAVAVAKTFVASLRDSSDEDDAR